MSDHQQAKEKPVFFRRFNPAKPDGRPRIFAVRRLGATPSDDGGRVVGTHRCGGQIWATPQGYEECLKCSAWHSPDLRHARSENAKRVGRGAVRGLAMLGTVPVVRGKLARG